MTEPVWIDLQINGRYGVSFTDEALDVAGVEEVTRRLAEEGTAGYLATITTCPPDVAERSLRVIAEARRRHPACAERILGVHMEGPFISPEDGYRGAHRLDCVALPDAAVYRRWQDASGGLVRLVTVAAELKGAEEFTRAVTADGCAVSLGHMAAKEPAALARLAAAGATALTHLGNGIPNEQPRHDNVMWSGLAADDLTVMFIPDGFHLPDPVLKTYVRAVPLDRLVAVSDCAYPGGMPPGRYESNGLVAVLEPNGFLRSPHSNSLAGSSCTLADAVKVLRRIGLTETECLALCRDNPLKLIGLKT